MARKLGDTDFQFAVPSGVPKRRKISVKNSDLNGELSSLSRSSSFSFKASTSYHDNLDSAFQSVATESSSKKSEPSNSMPRMSSFLVKDSRKLSRGSRTLTKMSAFSGSWTELRSSDTKKKTRKYSKNLKDDKFISKSSSESNLLFDKDYQDFITPLVAGDDGDSVDLDITPPVGDLFDSDEDINSEDDIKSSKDFVDLDVTPPVGDLFDSDEDEDDGDNNENNKDSVDLDITPPVGDLFDEDTDEDDDSKKEEVDLDKTPPVGDLFDDDDDEDDDDSKKEEVDLDKTPPVGDLFDDDDDLEKPASSSDSSASEDLQDITPPVSPSLSFGEDDVPGFDTWKITNSEGVILQTGNNDVDNPRATFGASRVFHVLPGDDQVKLTLTI